MIRNLKEYGKKFISFQEKEDEIIRTVSELMKNSLVRSISIHKFPMGIPAGSEWGMSITYLKEKK